MALYESPQSKNEGAKRSVVYIFLFVLILTVQEVYKQQSTKTIRTLTRDTGFWTGPF